MNKFITIFSIFLSLFLLPLKTIAQSYLSLKNQELKANQATSTHDYQYDLNTLSLVIDHYQNQELVESLNIITQLDLEKHSDNPKIQQTLFYLLAKIFYELKIYNKVIFYTDEYLTFFEPHLPILILRTKAQYFLNDTNLNYHNLLSESYFDQAKKYGQEIEINYRTMLFNYFIEQHQYQKAIQYIVDDQGVIQKNYLALVNERIINNPLVQFINSQEGNDIFNLIQTENEELNFLETTSNDALKESNEELNFLETTSNDTLKESNDIESHRQNLKIGVLLPLKHKSLKNLSTQVLQGIKMGLWKISQFQNPEFEFYIKNFGLNEKDNKLIVEKLIKDDNVDIILGPITKKSTLSVAKIAQKYHIPVISFSLTEDIGKDNPFLFRFQRNKTQETEKLSQFAFHYLNLERIAILYQNNPQSFQLAKEFWKQSKKNGAEIVAFEILGKNIKDYRNVYRKITGKYRFLSYSAKKANLQKESSDKNLGIDAIYLPINFKKFLQLESFMHAYDLNHAKILLNSDANIPELFHLKNKKNIYFADTYYNAFEMQKISELYQQFFSIQNKQTYLSSYTFYAYFSVLFLHELKKTSQNIAMELLRQKKIQLNNISIDINKHGDISPRIHILSYKGNKSYPYF